MLEGTLVSNPVELSVVHVGGVAARREREVGSFKNNEIVTLRNALIERHELGNVFATALLVISATGLRRGEACGLRVSAWGSATRTLSITQQVQGMGHSYRVTDLKTVASRRKVVVDSWTAEMLDKVTAGREPSEWLFPARYRPERPVNAGSLYNYHTALVKELALPALPVHGLRHTQASLLLACGAPTPDVAARLGHANAAITIRTYLHATLPSAELGDLWGHIAGK